MKHIRILILAMLLCLIALPASAQGRPSSPRAPQGREAEAFSPDPGARPSRRGGSGSAVTEDDLLSAMETLLSGLCERGVITEDDLSALLAELNGEETITDATDSAAEAAELESDSLSDPKAPSARRGRGRHALRSETVSESKTDSAAQSESGLDVDTLRALVESGMLTEQEYEELTSD